MARISQLIIFALILGLIGLHPAYAQRVNPDFLNQILVKEHDFIAIPLTRMPSGQLQLTMSINRADGVFILDTGATATTLDIKTKRKFRLTSRTFGGIVSGAGGAAKPLEKANSPVRLIIGELELSDFDLYLTNLDSVMETFASMGIDPVDGVVGADLLTAMNGIIDYQHQFLYLRP